MVSDTDRTSMLVTNQSGVTVRMGTSPRNLYPRGVPVVPRTYGRPFTYL